MMLHALASRRRGVGFLLPSVLAVAPVAGCRSSQPANPEGARIGGAVVDPGIDAANQTAIDTYAAEAKAKAK
jgi:hypothetical protein